MVHVFQDLLILAIGATPAPDPGATEAAANPGTGTYTVAVSPLDAARLLYLTRQYTVYLALVGPGTAPEQQAPVRPEQRAAEHSDGRTPGAGDPMSQLRDRIAAARVELVPEALGGDADVLDGVDLGNESDRVDDILIPAAPPPPPKPRVSLPPDVHASVHRQVVRDLGPLLFDDAVHDDVLEPRLRETIIEAFSIAGVATEGELYEQFATDIRNDVIGYGPIEALLNDDTVTEVMVNGPGIVFCERLGKVEEVASGFVDAAHVRRVIDKIVSHVGRRIDESSPMVDARLPDGSRVNAIIPPLAIDGPFLTIRKFAREPFMAADLVGFGTLDERSVRFLRACIEGRLNIVVSGGTGSGKTTLLNVLSSFIPNGERIVTVEDAKELQLNQRHVLCMETRPPNVERTGEVTIRDLVRNSLRMRPDRIVVGECRGGEALDMLQAMNTGHDGSMTTVHANSPRDALEPHRDADAHGGVRSSRPSNP